MIPLVFMLFLIVFETFKNVPGGSKKSYGSMWTQQGPIDFPNIRKANCSCYLAKKPCVRNEYQNPTFCPGSSQNTLIMFRRYIGMILFSTYLFSQIESLQIQNLKTMKTPTENLIESRLIKRFSIPIVCGLVTNQMTR